MTPLPAIRLAMLGGVLLFGAVSWFLTHTADWTAPEPGVAGQLIGILFLGLTDDIDLGGLPLVFANGLLLWGAFAAFGLAASVNFDRHAPALGISLAYVLVNYFLEILGSLWTDVAWSQEYPLFHHFQPTELLEGSPDPIDFVILGAAVLIPVIYALVVFPRRDLAAPD